MFALLASPHLVENFARRGGHVSQWLCTLPIWAAIPLGAGVAGMMAGVLLGAPTLKLRGDYLAIVTLGFGEIIRVFMNNLDAPVNITNGPMGIEQHRRHSASGRCQPGRERMQIGGFHAAFGHAALLPVLGGGGVRRHLSACACMTRVWGAPGWPFVKTRSRPRPWA
jgi:ABC-type branched-subunit amino acid transport system permease subunit